MWRRYLTLHLENALYRSSICYQYTLNKSWTKGEQGSRCVRSDWHRRRQLTFQNNDSTFPLSSSSSRFPPSSSFLYASPVHIFYYKHINLALLHLLFLILLSPLISFCQSDMEMPFFFPPVPLILFPCPMWLCFVLLKWDKCLQGNLTWPLLEMAWRMSEGSAY